jgi:Na+-transporting methylmalonyl-CoA/oxaloacetate decarboxylase gamma subunit
MSENLLLSLQITALGMGLVFAAIILLSGMMSLLTRLTAEKEDAPSGERASDSAQVAPVMDREFKAQAAAVAVAMALAELNQMPLTKEPPTALVSAWQLGMRTRQMYQKGGRKSS